MEELCNSVTFKSYLSVPFQFTEKEIHPEKFCFLILCPSLVYTYIKLPDLVFNFYIIGIGNMLTKRRKIIVTSIKSSCRARLDTRKRIYK